MQQLTDSTPDGYPTPKNLSENSAGSLEWIEPGAITEGRLVEIIFPQHTNHYGTLFGGQALAMMDKAAFIQATRFTRKQVVTARSEHCDFKVPIRQGQLVELATRVLSTGRTSVRVRVDVFAEDLLSGARQLATWGDFVLVALDETGRPTAVPQLTKPETGSSSELPGSR